MATICQDEQTTAFLDWFVKNGGTLHSAVGIAQFAEMGRGAIALEDIKENTVLFTIPRALTLSLRTCTLPCKFGDKAWKKHRLHRGWVGLILCLMWENAQGESGRWHSYLQTLPLKFNTPMFWDEEDVANLEGTSIYDKIGKKDADEDYSATLLPAIETRPDLFDPKLLSTYYSHGQYHLMGSRILSRSFHVDEVYEKDQGEGEESHGELLIPVSPGTEDRIYDGDDGNDDYINDDSDEEDPADVALVPMADALNARCKSENTRLYYESKDLQVIATKKIEKGQQIFNTYGDPPNSDLLRRYGHVDLIESKNGVVFNPKDIVEIRADLVVNALEQQLKAVDQKISLRIDWWLNRGDDVYIYEMGDDEPETPEDLISFIRVLTMSDDEWAKTQAKGKIPKPRMNTEVADILKKTLELRLKQYQTTLEEDKGLLTANISQNKRLAVIVRMGEKRILQSALQKLSTETTGSNTDTRTSQKRVSGQSSERNGLKTQKLR